MIHGRCLFFFSVYILQYFSGVSKACKKQKSLLLLSFAQLLDKEVHQGITSEYRSSRKKRRWKAFFGWWQAVCVCGHLYLKNTLTGRQQLFIVLSVHSHLLQIIKFQCSHAALAKPLTLPGCYNNCNLLAHWSCRTFFKIIKTIALQLQQTSRSMYFNELNFSDMVS